MYAQTSFQVYSPEQLRQVAGDLLAKYPQGRIFAFYGAMGVGKTTFIKSICACLGSLDVVNSPTYSIVNQYQSGKGEDIFHFDFYRVKHIAEVFNLGYEEYFFSDSYCFVEWPEKVEELLPEGCINVYMDTVNDHRVIRY